MNVEHDVVKALFRCSSPDGRVWCYVDELARTVEPSVMVLVERQLIRAREHGVNGQIEVRLTKAANGEVSGDYEPVRGRL